MGTFFLILIPAFVIMAVVFVAIGIKPKELNGLIAQVVRARA